MHLHTFKATGTKKKSKGKGKAKEAKDKKSEKLGSNAASRVSKNVPNLV
jgi:hypothetical protein